MVERPLRREGPVASYVRRDAEEERPHGLQTAEYALVLVVVAVIVVGVLLLAGGQIRSQLQQIVDAFGAASSQT